VVVHSSKFLSSEENSELAQEFIEFKFFQNAILVGIEAEEDVFELDKIVYALSVQLELEFVYF